MTKYFSDDSEEDFEYSSSIANMGEIISHLEYRRPWNELNEDIFQGELMDNDFSDDNPLTMLISLIENSIQMAYSSGSVTVSELSRVLSDDADALVDDTISDVYAQLASSDNDELVKWLQQHYDPDMNDARLDDIIDDMVYAYLYWIAQEIMYVD